MTNDYDTARDALRTAELELMQQRERVAEMRRHLPPGPVTDDYAFSEFVDGHEQRRMLTELFTDPDKPLIVYHFMFGKQQPEPCPMCSMWADGWSAVAGHVAARVNFAVAASSSAQDWAELGAARGWDTLRLVSAAPSSFKLDIGGEDAEGNQWPFLSVWELVDGQPQMTYSGGANIDAEHWRGIDLLSPVWHFFDLTKTGRGNWMPT